MGSLFCHSESCDSKTMANNEKWTLHHLVVFSLTFFSFSCVHVARKAFSNVKHFMQKEWTNSSVTLDPPQVWENSHFFTDEPHAQVFLGAMDTTFLLAYAVGLFISGIFGDRFNLTRILAFGMCSSAVAVFMFGTASKWIGIYNIWYYGVLMALNGLFQSTCWPCLVAVMGNWFGKSRRGIMFGLWSANASLGNILGALLVAALLDYGYEYAMLVPAAVLFAFGVVVFFCLIPSPDQIGLPMPEEGTQPFPVTNYGALSSTDPSVFDQEASLAAQEARSTSSSVSSNSVRPQPKKAITFCQAVILPGVIPYSLSYACLKVVHKSFFFWLPFYLSDNFDWKDTVADKFSTFYDVGSIAGGITGGLISDLLGRRKPLVVVMLMVAVPVVFIYGNTGGSYTINVALMCVTGFFVGGPANLIGSAISADLGRQGTLRADREALATVTGIVDGTGSVGAAIGQILIPEINTHSGWKPVFHLLMAMASMSIVCLLIPPFIKFLRVKLCGEGEPVYHQVITND